MRPRPVPALTLTLLLAAPAGCGRDDAAPEVAAAAPLVEDLRIGAVDGGAAAFGRIAALEADEDGRIYVADGLAKEVRVFSPDGRHLRTVGREGRGPGEFRALSGIAVGPEGRLWAMDPLATRVSVFDTAGTFVHSFTREFSFITSIPWMGGVGADGSVHDLTAAEPADASMRGRRPVVVRFRPENGRLVGLDTIALPETPRETYEARPAPGLREIAGVPHASERRWRLAPDGSVWTAITGAYRLDRIGAGGDTLATLRHAREPVPVSAAERDSLARATGAPAERIPQVRPAFHSFFVDAEGRVWVRPHVSDEAGTVWDVFGPDGALLGTVRTPLSVDTENTSPVVRGGYLYAVVTDDLDVPYVVRLRVPTLPSAGL